MSNRGIKNFEEFTENPFIGKKIGNAVDMEFILGLSKSAQNIIRYMMHKKIYLEDKFLFDLDDFNKSFGYTSRTAYLYGIIDLIKKNVLARTKLSHLYWVNQGFLNNPTLINIM